MKRLVSLVLTITMFLLFAPQVFAKNQNDHMINQTVSLGGGHNAVIKGDGSLWTWGSNSHGQLGDGTNVSKKTPVKVLENAVSVSLGLSHSAAIKTDGSLWMWGDNSVGQLGTGNDTDVCAPTKIAENVKTVVLGDNYSAIIKNDNSLWVSGLQESLRFHKEEAAYKFKKLLEDVDKVTIGEDFCVAVKSDQTLWVWGYLAVKNYEYYFEPIKMMDDVIFATTRDDEFGLETTSELLVIKDDNSLWKLFGIGFKQVLDNAAYADTSSSELVIDKNNTLITGEYGVESSYNIEKLSNVKKATVNGGTFIILKNDNSLWVAGYDESDENALYSSTILPSDPQHIMNDVRDFYTTYDTVAILKNDGSLWMCGWQPGEGATEFEYIYTPIKIMENVMISGMNNVASVEPIKKQNNPILSDNSPITIKLGEQKWLSAWVDGIYTEILDDELTVTSSDEDVLDIMSQQGWCSPGIEVIGTNETSECITTIDAYISAKNTGKSMLTYYCQGKEIGKVNVTVEPNIAETLSDELILKAKICADNPTYKHMVDTFNNPATLCTNSSSEVAAMMVEDLNSFIDAFSLEFDSKNYYEAVLMDMITSDTFYDTVKDSLYLDDLEFAGKKLNDIGDYAEEEINKLLSDEIKKGFDVDKFFTDISVLESVITAKDSFDAMNDKYKQLTALCLVSEEQICALEQLKQISAVPELTEACDTVIKAVKDANEMAVNKIAAGVFEGVEELFENVGQYGWDSLISLVPGVNAAKAIVASAQLVSNGLFNQDELSNDILLMDAVSVIDGYMDFKVKNTETLFTDYPTRDNAVRFMACANFYKSLCKYGCKATENFFKHYDEAFVTKMTGNNQSDRIDIVQYIAESIDDWNLYDSTGLDISKYLRNVVSETPSEWAKEYVEKAKNYGFLWPDMQNNYQNNITRAEFCMLLYNTMALKDTVKFEEIINSANKKITVEFDDVLFYYVTQVAKMGIINGTGNNKFEPLGEITREQAAKMLCAAAEVMGYNTTAPQTDLTDVSDWAKEGVNFVVNSGIMTGTDNGFEPQGTYTKEQAITTMVRFFENLK